MQTVGTLTQITVGSSTNVWGINYDGSVYRFDPPSQSWLYVPGVALVQIRAAFDGAVWEVDSINRIWRLDGQNWTQVPGSLAQIAIGADAVIWGLDANGFIYFCR